MDPGDSPLLTDLYQLTMLQAYLERGETGTAVFEFFVRALPERRKFLLAAGLEQALQFLEKVHFTREDIEWLAASGHFNRALLDDLARFRFTGDVHAVPEGLAFYADEPILRVTAPIMQAQLVETRLVNILHFQTLIASKAARLVLAAPGKTLIDFGLRRAHGGEAGLWAARASYLAGFTGTATVLAKRTFGIPAFGTMAHSFVQAFDDEVSAWTAFARSQPEGLILLIDTYDTEAAAHKIVRLAPVLQREGIRIRGVRLDSGDLVALSRSVRHILDEGGLGDMSIFASGGLDEDILLELARAQAPIDGFGIGTALTTSSDVPALDCAYKLQEYAGRPRRKRSTGKATWPGRKQVWRRYEAGGRMQGDVVSLEDDVRPEGRPLLRCVMRDGVRVDPPEPLETSRDHAALTLARLPEPLGRLAPDASPYPVIIARPLHDMAAACDRAQAAAEAMERRP